MRAGRRQKSWRPRPRHARRQACGRPRPRHARSHAAVRRNWHLHGHLGTPARGGTGVARAVRGRRPQREVLLAWKPARALARSLARAGRVADHGLGLELRGNTFRLETVFSQSSRSDHTQVSRRGQESFGTERKAVGLRSQMPSSSSTADPAKSDRRKANSQREFKPPQLQPYGYSSPTPVPGPPKVATTPSAFTKGEAEKLPGLEGLDRNLPEIRGPSKMVYRSRSLCCFKPAMQPRRLCIETIESSWFEPLILTTIMCNCLTMAWESPLDPEGTAKSGFIDVRLARFERPHHAHARMRRTPRSPVWACQSGSG